MKLEKHRERVAIYARKKAEAVRREPVEMEVIMELAMWESFVRGVQTANRAHKSIDEVASILEV